MITGGLVLDGVLILQLAFHHIYGALGKANKSEQARAYYEL